MLIFKHLNTGGWYAAHFRGRHRDRRTGEWVDTVQYQRLCVDLKQEEDIYTLYSREVNDFSEKFVHYSLEAFEEATGFRVTDSDFLKLNPCTKIKIDDIVKPD